MKKFLLGAVAFLVGVSLFALTQAVKADEMWNMTGNYTIDFVLQPGGGIYTHTMNVTSMDLVTGDFSGTGSGVSSTWTIVDGNVDGSTVSFRVDYDSSTYYVDVEGTIASYGSMSGTAASSYQTFTWSTTAGAAIFLRSAEITSPTAGEYVSGTVNFDAVLVDKDGNDNVQWAVRKGTCVAGQGTVFGNVDGFSSAYDWNGANFHALANTSTWELGSYCFVFNPTESAGDAAIRLTREFVLMDTKAPIVTIEAPEEGDVVDGVVDIYGTIEEDYGMGNYNIAIYPDGANFMDFSLRLEQAPGYPTTGFDNQLIYQWDTTGYEDGNYLIRFAARDAAGNRDLSLDPYSGGDDSQHVITVTVDHDLDNDGVTTGDFCPDTKVDVPTEGIGVNRHIWTGIFDNNFETLIPGGAKGVKNPAASQFTIAVTKGCSCKQILDSMSATTGFDFGGHYKFGCSKSIIEDWISGRYYIGPTFVETVEVLANDADGVMSLATLGLGKDYFLKAYGIGMACNQPSCMITFDAEYSTSDGVIPWSTWADGVASPYDSYGTNLLDLMVDGYFVDWGLYNPLHTYQIPYAGTGNTLDLGVYDIAGSYGNDTGILYVDIIEDRWVDLW